MKNLKMLWLMFFIFLFPAIASGAILFQEGFEDSNFTSRGWYVSANLQLSTTEHIALPDDPSVSDTLGWIYYKKQAYLMAISFFKESLAKQPNNPTIRYHLGMAYYKKGDKKLAKEELSASLKLSKEFPGSEEAKKIVAELSKETK